MGKENSRSSGEVLAVKFFFFLINVEIITNLFFFSRYRECHLLRTIRLSVVRL